MEILLILVQLTIVNVSSFKTYLKSMQEHSFPPPPHHYHGILNNVKDTVKCRLWLQTENDINWKSTQIEVQHKENSLK